MAEMTIEDAAVEGRTTTMGSAGEARLPRRGITRWLAGEMTAAAAGAGGRAQKQTAAVC
jgi:hypothetical protein